MPERRPTSVAAALLLVVAGCGMGSQVAAGPVLGHAWGEGVSLGWEAGGGPMKTEVHSSASLTGPSLIARANGGMSWRPRARNLVSYLAWEPWYLVGGSLGAAYSTGDRKVNPLFGVWEALPPSIDGERATTNYVPPSCSPCYTVSVPFGWRWSGRNEIYLTPKFGILQGVDVPWPYWTYPD